MLLQCIHLVLCGGHHGLAKGPGFHSSVWGREEWFVMVLEAEEKSLCAAIPADSALKVMYYLFTSTHVILSHK